MRVQSVHGYHIAKLLPTERPLVVSRGQTFRLQKCPHHLLVDHTMNVRLARPPVGTSTQRWKRVDVALETSLQAQVALGVFRLQAVVPFPIGLVVVERTWWRLIVDGHHPCQCRLSDELGVLVSTSGHVLVCRVQLMTSFLLSESFAREEVLEEFPSQQHAGTTVRSRLDIVHLPLHGKRRSRVAVGVHQILKRQKDRETIQQPTLPTSVK